MDWADLVTLDLSEFEQPGGKESLVKQLDHAVRNVGTYTPSHFQGCIRKYLPMYITSYVRINMTWYILGDQFQVLSKAD